MNKNNNNYLIFYKDKSGKVRRWEPTGGFDDASSVIRFFAGDIPLKPIYGFRLTKIK